MQSMQKPPDIFRILKKTILKDRHIKLNITGLAAFIESLKHEGAVKLTGYHKFLLFCPLKHRQKIFSRWNSLLRNANSSHTERGLHNGMRFGGKIIIHILR